MAIPTMSTVMRSTCQMARVAVLLTVVAGCASAPVRPTGPPVLTDPSTSVVAQGLTETTLRFSGHLTSPGAAVLERAEYELVSDGRVVKSGTRPLGLALTPGAPLDVEFQEVAPYARSAEDLARLGDADGTVLVALRGTLVVRAGATEERLPFAASRTVRVPRPPVVVLEGLEGARYSAEEVQLNLRLGVRNPNPFPLRLERLTYQVGIAGKLLEEGTATQADTVAAASTGVYPVEISVTRATWGPEVRALISKGALPWTVKGELTGPTLKVPYTLGGDVKLNVSR
nr:LEA type 2 family protein [Citreicoccus inhibens]